MCGKGKLDLLGMNTRGLRALQVGNGEGGARRLEKRGRGGGEGLTRGELH